MSTQTIGTGSGGVGLSEIQVRITESGTNHLMPTEYALPILSNPYSPQQHMVLSLATGPTSVSIPPTAGAVTLIVPVNASPPYLRIATNSGDMGFSVFAGGGPIGPIPLSNPPPATLYFQAGGAFPNLQIIFS